MKNTILVNLELGVFEEIIKVIQAASHPMNGGQIHSMLNNLLTLRENAISNHNQSNNEEIKDAT